MTRQYKTVVFIFSLIIFLCSYRTVSADIEILKEIVEAEHELSYVGVRLRTNGSRTMEELVIHKSEEDTYRKTISILGEEKSIEEDNRRERRDGDRRRGRERGDREARWERQRSQFSISEIKLIAENYELEHKRWGEKIAGYKTDILIIKPKFEGRPTKYIYFAHDNYLILKVQDLDAAGVLRGMFVYTRISFDPEAVSKKWDEFSEEIRVRPRTYGVISIDDANKMLKKKRLIQPTYLPSGFQLQHVYKHSYRGRHPVRLKYTDGLLDYSIFVTLKQENSDEDDHRGWTEILMGETKVFKHPRSSTNAYSWTNSGIRYFLAGPIPSTEMENIVESIINQFTQNNLQD
ncbi:hypothetical protein C6497_11245 [Candidatus Poribacteria bacterium]|nr:MAG: hypothetical protein C6497_11245 [Candidatus Poribacteria bacterium]